MTRAIPFDRQAIQRIHEIARGVPRRINLLCDRAMLGAYAHGVHQIDTEVIEKSAREVFGKSEPAGPDRSRLGSSAGLGLFIATGIALTALLVFAIYGAYRKFATPPPPAASAPAVGASAASGAAGPASSASALPAASGTASSASTSAIASATATTASAASATSPGSASAPMRAASAANVASAPVLATAVVPASAPAIAASAPVLGAAELKAQWKTVGVDEKSAWRELASMWNLTPGEADACAAAAKQQVRCFKFASTLAMVKSLDRPGFMSLRDDAGRTTTVVLVGLGADTATLRAEGRAQKVSLPALTKLWTGEFGTLWRMPPGYTTAVAEGASGPLVDRLATQLAALAGESAPPPRQTMDAALRTKVARFQTAHGLNAVGKAGPTTFMQLNRATGVDEPRLDTSAP
jgi:general secretion pathway protein A